MRKGRRKTIQALALGFIVGLLGVAASARSLDPSGDGDAPVRLTVEIAWTALHATEAEPPEVDLDVPEGRILEAIAISPGQARPAPIAGQGGLWRLGGARIGRARVRLEAPISGGLRLRAGGQMMRFPLALVLEGAQKTPAQSPVEITVERVAWDVIQLDFIPEGPNAGPPPARIDGAYAAGAVAPVSIAFNVLAPEVTEVNLRCSAELRPAQGGEPVWRGGFAQLVATNRASPVPYVLPVELPKTSGTYVLEVRAAWEAAPVQDSSKFIGRLIRRGRRSLFGSPSAERRATLVALNPTEGQAQERETAAVANPKAQEVDAIDLSRPRAHRPTASGRSPLSTPGRSRWPVPAEALTEATRRDLVRGWIARVGTEVSQLAPADGSGLAWSALGLKVARPGRPHRLTVSVAGGHPAALGVALVGVPANVRPGARPRLLLDSCVAGPPIEAGGPPASYSWLVWPDSPEPVLVLVNRDESAAVQVGSVTLSELSEVPAGPVVDAPADLPARGIGLVLSGPEPLARYGVALESGLTDVLAASRSLASHARFCGATAVVLPESMTDRQARRALDGQAAEDSLGPDRQALAIQILGAHGISSWIDLDLLGQAPLPGLPGAAQPEALARNLTRVDRLGRPDGAEPCYNPIAPEVSAAMQRKVAEIVTAAKPSGGIAGILIRLGSGPTLLGPPDTGLDDATFAHFVREAFDAETARGLPGLSNDDPGRFEARSKFLAGSGRMPWLTWRSKQVAALYASLAASARAAAPNVKLAVATPGVGEGPAGAEARRADIAGFSPSLAWRAVGLDLDCWATGQDAPIVLRGAGLGQDDLARDLATSPELDDKVARRPDRGLFLDAASPPPAAPGVTLSAPAIDAGPNGDEPLGHALAALDARWVWLGMSAVSGHEERIRRFARVFRALPATPASETQPLPFGVSVRAHPVGGKSYLALANDTPYPIRLDTVFHGPADATVHDLGRAVNLKPGADAAGRHLVLDLLPYGVAGVRVDAPNVSVSSVTPYPSETVLTGLRAQYEAISERLSILSRGREQGDPEIGPPNGQFEPDAPLLGTTMTLPNPSNGDPTATKLVEAQKLAPKGWQMVGGAGNGVSIDLATVHAGRGSLRLDVTAPPGSAASDTFAPHANKSLVVRSWLRSDRPDARVRVWIEGESKGTPYRRVSDLVVAEAWAERAIKAADLPPSGLDQARLRFELLGAGSLWVDDVSVAGETLTEPERRNARNAMLAAIQAYRDKRFADFARLAGSHWARRPGTPELVKGGAIGPDRVAADEPGEDRPSGPTELPRTRRLR